MPVRSSQHPRRQAGKVSNSAGWFFDQYVADASFSDMDNSVNDCATELLDSMEADRSLESLGGNKDLELETLPFMGWESTSLEMEGMCDSWSTPQNSSLTCSSSMYSEGPNDVLSNFDGSFQHAQCSDSFAGENQTVSNDFDLNMSTVPGTNAFPSTENPTHHGSQDSDMDSFAVLNAAFKDLIQAKAAADSRPVSQKTKQRDASISLHLQRLRAACDRTAQLLENPSTGHESRDSGSQLEKTSPCSDEADVFQMQLPNGTRGPSDTPATRSTLAVSPVSNHDLENSTTTWTSSSGHCSPQNSPPESNCSGPSQRSLPELSSCSDTSPSTTQPHSSAQTPASSHEIHNNGALEIVLDMNMNPSKCLPRKQRKRSQAQRERYQNVRKHGACLKHKKLKKLCTCFDNVLPQAGACQKIEATGSRLANTHSDAGPVRARQSAKSTQTNFGPSALPVPSSLPEAATSPGHDRLLSEKHVQNKPGAVCCENSSQQTSSSLLCLIPGCIYSAADVSALESHYASMHARELSFSTPVSLISNSPLPRQRTDSVWSTSVQRSGVDNVQSPARIRPECSPATVHTDTSELFSLPQTSLPQTMLQVDGSGKVDPDIDCRIVGSCDVHSDGVKCRQHHAKPGRADDALGLSGLFSVPSLWFVGLFWNLLVRLFAWVLSNRPSVSYTRKNALVPQGLFGNVVVGIS